ncbi:MAG: FKBP-type peptidyl-prolyl cis-trans isomerase [Prevotellaceae bacterium]|nr:FKBP-type peptidyl-prolyl cis-trans isomerase [Prevotellaceae bacterium]
MDKISYALGMVIGQNLKGMGIREIDGGQFARGAADVLAGNATDIAPDKAGSMVQQFLQQQEAEQAKVLKAAGETFLKENAARPGVTTTASGLQYEVLTPAIGRKPAAADSVKCHYEGRLTDGTVFDSSYKRGEPATFPLNGVIKGWTEGLQLMAEGAKFRFFIPYDLAYGARGAGSSIPPYAALVFDVELIAVV